MDTKVSTVLVIFAMALGLTFGFIPTASADVNIPGMGSGAYDVPSVGGPGDSVDKAPVCDNRARPKIMKIEPDPMKPGDKITIKGENFGTKECFHGVSFGGVADSTKISFKYVNEMTVEATVPAIKPGLSRVNVVTSGGSSQAIVLIQAK
ncbi:MAG TPA: IPT/TIG domain-containing protein [Nitrospirales bacterium]|nr:IPT/TIG domain-containing protein [Nitrospirales bacterium]